jgi:hypothetical protein
MSLRWLVVLTAAVIAAMIGSGCLPMIIGSVGSAGYEAYEYHKTGTLPGMPQQQRSSAKDNSQWSGRYRVVPLRYAGVHQNVHPIHVRRSRRRRANQRRLL